MTAYFGFLEQEYKSRGERCGFWCARAVGSVVGQIAKIKGVGWLELQEEREMQIYR